MESPFVAAGTAPTNAYDGEDPGPFAGFLQHIDLPHPQVRTLLLGISALFRNLANAPPSRPLDPELGNLTPMFTLPTPQPPAPGEHSIQPQPANRALHASFVNETIGLLAVDDLNIPSEIPADAVPQAETFPIISVEQKSDEVEEAAGGEEEEEEDEEELLREFCQKYDKAEILFLHDRCKSTFLSLLMQSFLNPVRRNGLMENLTTTNPLGHN